MAAPALIYCAGGSPRFRTVASACGWLNGARLPDSVYDPPLFFADQNYHHPDRIAYMRALVKHRPEMATVLDLESEEQLFDVLSWSEEASQFVRCVVIIPKVSGMLPLIPDRIGGADVILGYSVPTSYGGTVVPVWEFGRRPVHLLGGSPQAQLRLRHYLNVVSLDGGMPQQQANRGRFWCRALSPIYRSHWWQLSEAGDVRREGVNMECFRRSLENIAAVWL